MAEAPPIRRPEHLSLPHFGQPRLFCSSFGMRMGLRFLSRGFIGSSTDSVQTLETKSTLLDNNDAGTDGLGVALKRAGSRVPISSSLHGVEVLARDAHPAGGFGRLDALPTPEPNQVSEELCDRPVQLDPLRL